MSDISPSSAFLSLLDEDDDMKDVFNCNEDDYDEDMLLDYDSDQENIEPFPTKPPQTPELADYESDVEVEPEQTKPSQAAEEQSSEYEGEKDGGQVESSFGDYGGRPLPSFSSLPGTRSPPRFGSVSSFGSLGRSVSVPSSGSVTLSTVTASVSSSSSNLMDLDENPTIMTWCGPASKHVDETDAPSDFVMRPVVPRDIFEGIRVIKREDLKNKTADLVKKEDDDVKIIGSVDNEAFDNEVQIIGFKQGHDHTGPVVASFDGKGFPITGKAGSRGPKKDLGAVSPPTSQPGISGCFPPVKRSKPRRFRPYLSGRGGSQVGYGHGCFSISGLGRGGFSPPGHGGVSPAGRDGVSLAGRGGVHLVSRGGVPLAGRGGVPLVGRGGVPLVGRGGVPLVGRGGVPLVGRGGVPLVGRGGVPLVGRGGVPLVGRGGVPLVGRGGVPLAGRGGVPLARRRGFVAAASRSFQMASNFLNKYINQGPELASVIINCPKFHEEKEKRIKRALQVRTPIDCVVQRSDGSGLVYVTKTFKKDSVFNEISILNSKKFDGAYLVATLFRDQAPENFPAVVLNLY